MYKSCVNLSQDKTNCVFEKLHKEIIEAKTKIMCTLSFVSFCVSSAV